MIIGEKLNPQPKDKEDSLESELEQKEDEKFEKLKKSIGYEKFEMVRDYLRFFFVYYMVWIFHMIVLMGMSFEQGDFFSLALFCVDSVVFISHLYLTWVCAPSERNIRMRKWWYPSFIMIIILICFRYFSFYTRYLTLRKLLCGILNQFSLVDNNDPNKLFSETSSFSRLFIKIDSTYKIDKLYSEFYLELIYLGASCLTLISLKMKPTPDSPSDPDDNDSPEIRSKGRSTLTVVSLGNNDLNQSITKNEIIDMEEKPHSDTKVNGKASRDPHEDKPAGSRDDGANEERNDAEKGPEKNTRIIDRNYFIIFFCFFILLRSLSFVFVVYTFESNMDILNFLFIIAEITYFNLLFWNLTSVDRLFNMESFIKLNLDYFKRSFVDKLNFQNSLAGTEIIREDLFGDEIINIEDNDNDDDYFGSSNVHDGSPHKKKISEAKVNKLMSHNIVRDIEQNRYFLDQFLLKFEKEVTNISTHISFLKVVIISLKGYFLLADFIYNIYKEGNDTKNIIEQNRKFIQQNTMFMGLILTELLLVKHYSTKSNSNATKKEEPVVNLSKYIIMIISKFEYYCNFAEYKIKESVEETKIKKDNALKNNKNIPPRGSSFFDVTNLSGVGAKEPIQSTAKMFMKRKETLQDRMRSERIVVDIEELWIKEKKTIFEKMRGLYKSFLIALIESQKLIPLKFNDTYHEFCFEDPQSHFKEVINLDESEEEEEGIEEFSIDSKENDDEKRYRFGMGEGTSKLVKFLFVHRNSHKYKFCLFLSGLLVFIRRLILLPLLYIASTESKIISLPLLLVGIVYALRGSKSVTSDLKLFMPIFSFMFLFLFIVYLTKDSSLISKEYVKNYGVDTRQPLIVMSSFFSLIAITFILTVCLAYFIVDHLFICSKRPSEIFFGFHLNKGIEVLNVNFLEWNNSVFSGVNSLFSLVYDHLLDYYLVAMYVISVINKSVYNSFLLVLAMFMISSQVVPSLKKYSIKSYTPERLKNFTYIFNLVIFILLANYSLASVLKTSETISKIQFWKILLDESLSSFLFVAILNFAISDFTNSEDYKNEKIVLNKKNELKMKFAALHQAYHENEEVIYQRVQLIKKLKDLDGIEKKFWDNVNNWKDLDFDPNYWQLDVVQSIKKKEAELKKKNVNWWVGVKSSVAEGLYRYCAGKTSVSFFEDFLYLLLQVFSKNHYLLRGGIINIDDYYSGDFTKYENVFKDISNFYHRLKNKETLPSNTYRIKYLELMKKVQLMEKRQEEINSRNQIKKKNFDIRRMSLSETEFKPKERQELKKVANLLFSILIHEKNRGEESTSQGSDSMICNFSKYRVKFYNLKSDLLKSTQGYQKLKIKVLMRMFGMFFVSRLEYVVSILIILLQIYKGGIENFVIIGIIFFCILIETHHGHSKWWSALFYIYLLKCTVAYIFENIALETRTSLIKGSFSFIFNTFFILGGSPEYGYDALILISIFILQQSLRMKGFSENYLIEFEDPGTCIARVGFYYT